MPPNTVYVGRPTRWGNPYGTIGYVNLVATREEAISRYEAWLRSVLREDPDFLEPLRGKDLTCWCPLNKPCHADVILKLLERKQ